MSYKDALEIVLALARENALEPTKCDPDLLQEAFRQQEALDMIERIDIGRITE